MNTEPTTATEPLASDAATVLKPCPFCGSEVSIEHIPAHKHEVATFMGGQAPDTFFIECPGCPVGVLANDRNEVIALWNRRDNRHLIAETISKLAGFLISEKELSGL
jgi:hypothetical protein